jgi:hypothetical protein
VSEDAGNGAHTTPGPVVAAGAPAEAPSRAARPGPQIVKALIPVVVILVVCVAAVAVHVSNFRHLGPIDEQAHLDYVNRVASGELPALGDKLSHETRREIACRGIETPAGFGDRLDCDLLRPVKTLPEDGNSYEATQPPLYYAVTAVLSRVTPGDDVDSIRRVGALWLAVGGIALYFTLRRFKVGTVYALVLSLALTLTPTLLATASVASNDIAVWTWGAVALLIVVTLLKGPPLRVPALFIAAAVGAVGGLVKPITLLVVIALALAAILAQWWAGRPKWGFLFAGSLVVGALATTGAWGLVVNHLRHVPLKSVEPWARYHVSSLDLSELVKQPLFKLVSVLGAYLPATWRTDWRMAALVQLGIYVEVGILLLPLLSRTPSRIGRGLGIAYLSVVAISGPYYVILYYVSTQILYGADNRFAFGLLPMMGVVLVAWVQPRWQRWTVAALLALPAIWYLVLVSGIADARR